MLETVAWSQAPRRRERKASGLKPLPQTTSGLKPLVQKTSRRRRKPASRVACFSLLAHRVANPSCRIPPPWTTSSSKASKSKP
ncbi:hypothetical protein [Lysobacter gummosus]|uniref:hypothetical protein n=1 Tax=Lysobacter gummosus TaxID=262324 RepID=UPI00362A7F8E